MQVEVSRAEKQTWNEAECPWERRSRQAAWQGTSTGATAAQPPQTLEGEGP